MKIKDHFIYLCIGTTLLSVSTIFLYNYVSPLVKNIIILLSLFLIIYSFIKDFKYLRNPFKGIYYYIFAFLLIWSILTGLRGFIELDITSPITYIDRRLWLWLFPLLVLIPLNNYRLELIKKTTIILAIISIVVFFINIRTILSNASYVLIPGALDDIGEFQNKSQAMIKLCIPSGLFLLSFKSTLSKKEFIIIFIAFILSLIGTLLGGRRTASMYSIIFILLSFFNIKKSLQRNIFIFIILLSLLVILFILNSSTLESLFPTFFSRLTMDTRSEVEYYFWKDFSNINDWIFGRGSNGTYFDPTFINSDIKGYRNGIETGYMNCLLFGGLLFFIPFLIISILGTKPRNLLFTNSLFYRGAYFYVIINLLFLTVGNIFIMSAQYIFFWIILNYLAKMKFTTKKNI